MSTQIPTPPEVHALAVRVVARHPDEWCAVVDYPAGSVVTRWSGHRRRGRPYRCAECGPQRASECRHLRAAVLAMQAQDALLEGARA